MFSLYNYKFLFDMRMHLYENFISFGFSFCNQSKCDDDKTDPHYSGFMIFSYSNTTDVYLNLANNHNIDINNITIDLKHNSKIENNIFGLVYSNIQIKDLINCDNISFISTLNNTVISKNYKLKENENIKLTFKDNNYYHINCTLKYTYFITEPNFDIYNIYTNKITTILGVDNKINFNKEIKIYEGKTSFYNIFFEEDKYENEISDKLKENEKEEEEEEKEINQKTYQLIDNEIIRTKIINISKEELKSNLQYIINQTEIG